MKKLLLFPLIFILLIMTPFLSLRSVALTQTSAPYDTFTIGPRGRYILTQTAYEPAGFMNLSSSLNGPEDMFIKDDIIYVADTGNRRIIKIDETGLVTELVTNLNEPTGVHVDEENQIYVADKGARMVYKYDIDGNLLDAFGRPTEPIFGQSSVYVPTKITTGPRGVMYVVGEGSTGGIIQLNHMGEFLGFFAANQTTMSWYQVLARWFSVNLARNIPRPPTNVAIDEKGSVFTVSNLSSEQIKKFNISSTAILSISNRHQPLSIAINDFDNIYTLSADGIITEYDSYGNLIFEFGGTVTASNQVLGLFVAPVDIDVDSNSNIYVLDRGSNQIHMLQKSEFTQMVHQGLIDFKNGIYDIEQWEEVLRMNSVFALANSSIARANYRQMNYDEALEYYRIAYNRQGYSDAFWQIRYAWMQNYLGLVFGLAILAFVAHKSLQLVDKHYHIYQPVRNFNQKTNDYKLVRELKLILRMIRHPLDTFYEIKRNHKASYLSATIIYLIALVISVVVIYGTSFIFNPYYVERYNLIRGSATTIGVVMLFVFANYLISTLSSGEGWFRDIYIGTAYALAPYVLMRIPLMLLSHVLTFNEVFIYDSLLSIVEIWSLLLIVIMVKQMHNYKIIELIKNLLLTIFTMIMIVLVGFLIYLLANQMWNFFESIIREVIIRA